MMRPMESMTETERLRAALREIVALLGGQRIGQEDVLRAYDIAQRAVLEDARD